MKELDFINIWKQEESIAHIHGWDFSHIDERYAEDLDFPWEYRNVINAYRRPDMHLLDIDTGGGEVLLRLQHSPKNTAATEAYPPNVDLCKKTLLPLGIDFREADGNGPLPFADGAFDLVINRHGNYNPQEIFRVLKPGGILVMQQVGAENDRELVELLMGSFAPPFPENRLEIAVQKFRAADFDILDAQECFRKIQFFDIGALVWFARIIEWEFPDFSVDKCKDSLLRAQQLLERNGCVDGQTHRFLLVAQKSK